MARSAFSRVEDTQIWRGTRPAWKAANVTFPAVGSTQSPRTIFASSVATQRFVKGQ